MQELTKKILKELEEDSRQTNVQIAKKLKVSEGTVRQRIGKLVKFGIIKRFTIDLSTKQGFAAIVLLKTDPQLKTELIVKNLKKIEAIKSILETTGEYDIVLEISANSALEFNGVIENIRTLNGVRETESLVVLKKS